MACNYYRDAAGFCRLVTRCWSGKPCPKSEREAERARLQYIDELIWVRAGRRSQMRPPVITRTSERKQR